MLTTEQDAVSLFKLKNLIHFYLHVVKSIVSPVHATSSPSANEQAVAAAAAVESAASPPDQSASSDASLKITSSTPAGDNSLVATLNALHGLADKMFLNALNCQGRLKKKRE